MQLHSVGSYFAVKVFLNIEIENVWLRKVSRSCEDDPLEQMLRDAAPVEISLSLNEQEMQQFNSLPRVSKDVDVCQWWLQHSQTLPLLFNDARHVLGVAVSSSGSERDFSTCGRLDTSRRARLTSDSLLFRWFRLILTSPSSFGHLLKHFILLRLFRHEIISSVSFPIVPTSNIFLNYSIVSTDSTKSQKLMSGLEVLGSIQSRSCQPVRASWLFSFLVWLAVS